MPSNNAKYNSEFRERTCQHILESGKPASRVGAELGISKGTICKWMQEYRKQHKMPSYAESLGIKQAAGKDAQVMQRQSKIDQKRIKELEEEIEILKKALRIFMQAP